jgi:hypothetical protein
LPDETVGATTEFWSKHVTLVMAVGGSRVRACVAVKLDCTCEIAVIVTVLYCWLDPGITVGAVYNPPAVMDPTLDPVGAPEAAVTVQFTSVLLRFKTLAVHWDVPSRVTSVGVQDMVMVGVVAVELDPQELKIPSVVTSPKKKRTRSQRTLPHPTRKFDSSTRNPPARFALIYLGKLRLPATGGLKLLPLPHTRNRRVEYYLKNWTDTHSPRGIDAESHHSVACTKTECDNRPSLPDKVKRNPNFPFAAAGISQRLTSPKTAERRNDSRL